MTQYRNWARGRVAEAVAGQNPDPNPARNPAPRSLPTPYVAQTHVDSCLFMFAIMFVHVCNQNPFTLIFRYYYYSIEELGGRVAEAGAGQNPDPNPDPKPAPPGLPAPYVAHLF